MSPRAATAPANRTSSPSRSSRPSRPSTSTSTSTSTSPSTSTSTSTSTSPSTSPSTSTSTSTSRSTSTRASFASCPELEFVDGDLADLGDLPPGLASWDDDPVESLESSGLRRRPRVPLEVEVGLSGDNTFFAGLSMDVVDGGLFVATWQALPVGTLVEVSFVLPGGHAVTAPGVVVFVIDEREELPPGMGISLSDLTSLHLEAIRRFCKQRPPTYYDVD